MTFVFVKQCGPRLKYEGFVAQLPDYAAQYMVTHTLWALEKNTRATRFYQRHGFQLTGEKRLEDGTSEYLLRMQHIP